MHWRGTKLPPDSQRPWSVFSMLELKACTLVARASDLAEFSCLRNCFSESIDRSENGRLPTSYEFSSQLIVETLQSPGEKPCSTRSGAIASAIWSELRPTGGAVVTIPVTFLFSSSSFVFCDLSLSSRVSTRCSSESNLSSRVSTRVVSAATAAFASSTSLLIEAFMASISASQAGAMSAATGFGRSKLSGVAAMMSDRMSTKAPAPARLRGRKRRSL